MNRPLQKSRARGEECGICLLPIEGKVVRHKTCSLECCQECLDTWLKENTSCLVCRARLHTSRGEDGQALDIVEEWDDQTPPTQYHVVDKPAAIREILRPLMTPETFAEYDFYREYSYEQFDTELVLETLGFRRSTHTIAELVSAREVYKLSKDDLQRLWFAERVYGVQDFYLLVFQALPTHGFFLPVIPRIRRLESADQLQTLLQDRNRGPLAYPQYFYMAQIPLPTKHFADLVRASSKLYPDDSQVNINELYRLARDKEITHWCLVGLAAGTLKVSLSSFLRPLYAVPWPTSKIQKGYKSLKFPGLDGGNECSSTWSQHYDRKSLDRLVEQWKNERSLAYNKHAREYFGQDPVEPVPTNQEVAESFGQRRLPELIAASIGSRDRRRHDSQHREPRPRIPHGGRRSPAPDQDIINLLQRWQFG